MMKTRIFLIIAGLVLGGLFPVLAEQQKPAALKTTQVKPREIKIDRNYDGVIDRVEVYNSDGSIIRVEADSNSDGKIDEWVYYEGNMPVKGEKDVNADGKPDTTLIYDAKGVIIRSETDANSDGKIDEWVYYESNKPVRAEKDTNKDGKPDTWLNY